MELIGSKASPYVRRIRLQLENRNYQFTEIDVLSQEGQSTLLKYSPTRKVPILIDNEKIIIDSSNISLYIEQVPFDSTLNNELILINDATDSALILLQLKKFSLDPNAENYFSKNHQLRLHEILFYFEKQYKNTEKDLWNKKEQWLFCLLDWLNFREIYKWEDKFNHLKSFYLTNSKREICSSTDPRN